MEIQNESLKQLHQKLEDINGVEEMEIIKWAIDDLDVKNVGQFLEIKQEWYGVTPFMDRDTVYKSEQEAIDNGVDEYDLVDAWKQTYKGETRKELDNYEADALRTVQESFSNASKEFPEIKDWDVSNIEVGGDTLERMMDKVKTLDLANTLNNQLSNKQEQKQSKKIKI